MVITILLIVYFSINTFLATEVNDKTEIVLYYFFGLPFIILCTLASSLIGVYWKFINYTGLSFLYGFYISRRYDNLSPADILRVKKYLTGDDPRRARWAKKILDKNNAL